MVCRLKIEVLKKKLYAFAVFLSVGVPDCYNLLLVDIERIFSLSCHRVLVNKNGGLKNKIFIVVSINRIISVFKKGCWGKFLRNLVVLIIELNLKSIFL